CVRLDSNYLLYFDLW
nr:immunoglobulin heavy chain junction region [Macaca mulatta]